MITQSKFIHKMDGISHAIFWRPIKYFSGTIHERSDGLDSYEVCSFLKGNKIFFDLRWYKGHPEGTTSLYISSNVVEIEEIIEIVNLAISGFKLPKSAIGWQRGIDDDISLRERIEEDRLKESEARIIALKIAAISPNRTATTDTIKDLTPSYFNLTVADLQQSKTRSREPLWRQIVGNVISHKHSKFSPFRNGYAVMTRHGLYVTDKGIRYLSSIGFCVSFD